MFPRQAPATEEGNAGLPRKKAQTARQTSPSANLDPAKYLAVRKQGKIEIVPLQDIAYIRGAHNYSELVLRDGRRLLHDKSLEKLRLVLPAGFERVHKSYLVRFSDIAAIHVHEGTRYEVELHSGQRLPVGRTRHRDLVSRLV